MVTICHILSRSQRQVDDDPTAGDTFERDWHEPSDVQLWVFPRTIAQLRQLRGLLSSKSATGATVDSPRRPPVFPLPWVFYLKRSKMVQAARSCRWRWDMEHLEDDPWRHIWKPPRSTNRHHRHSTSGIQLHLKRIEQLPCYIYVGSGKVKHVYSICVYIYTLLYLYIHT